MKRLVYGIRNYRICHLTEMNLPPNPLVYYQKCHHKRKFFSVRTAAELLYRSIKLKEKEVKGPVFWDRHYGGFLKYYW
jgi:hypothetical protein